MEFIKERGCQVQHPIMCFLQKRLKCICSFVVPLIMLFLSHIGTMHIFDRKTKIVTNEKFRQDVPNMILNTIICVHNTRIFVIFLCMQSKNINKTNLGNYKKGVNVNTD